MTTTDFASALDIDEDAFVRAGAAALSRRKQIERVADELTARGVTSLAFIGSGGTYANAFQFEQLARLSSTLPVRVLVAAEVVASGDPLLTATSIAVFTSDSGTTEDVRAAIDYCRSRGVHTIGFVPVADSPIAQAVDSYIQTEPEWRGWDIYLLLLTARLLSSRGEFDGYEQLATELSLLPAALLEVAKRADPIAKNFAQAHRDTQYMFLVGSGNLWGFTYIYSMCVLEEMLWIRTTRVTGAEFFHGSLELIERDTPVLILQGEDFSRPITDRAIRFAREYSDDVTVLDSKDHALAGISERFRPLVSSAVIGAVTRRISLHLQNERDRDLTLRRYYRVVPY
ncbi:SIS domain-containing protein [Rathayibacter soli]|uniref:SIS domain-containing protein n=1 Tax=Rathayibacter soli TaxID=3144168 RepID=UPI0027E509D5|nr:SIS domain-containing protein [Glaciibacter superstes]